MPALPRFLRRRSLWAWYPCAGAWLPLLPSWRVRVSVFRNCNWVSALNAITFFSGNDTESFETSLADAIQRFVAAEVEPVGIYGWCAVHLGAITGEGVFSDLLVSWFSGDDEDAVFTTRRI